MRLQYKIKGLHKKVIRHSKRSNHSLEHPKRKATIEPLESAKQQLEALLAQMKWYTIDWYIKRMNRIFTKNSSTVYSQLKG